jgi:hypothetical protein
LAAHLVGEGDLEALGVKIVESLKECVFVVYIGLGMYLGFFYATTPASSMTCKQLIYKHLA